MKGRGQARDPKCPRCLINDYGKQPRPDGIRHIPTEPKPSTAQVEAWILDSVCDAALDRGAQASWLYDRFAVGAWWKRRADGISWLTCDEASVTFRCCDNCRGVRFTIMPGVGPHVAQLACDCCSRGGRWLSRGYFGATT